MIQSFTKSRNYNYHEERTRCTEILGCQQNLCLDLISQRLLWEGANYMAYPYSIFKRSLALGYFLPSWKDASLSPIHTKYEKFLTSNYRPISLLSLADKPMEQGIHKHLYNYIISNDNSISIGLCTRWFYYLSTTAYLSVITPSVRLYPADTLRLYNVASTSMQRHDVASTLRRRCINVMCPLGRQQ